MKEKQTQKRTDGINGYSIIEILVVLAAIGLFAVLAFPSVMNSLETRSLDNTAREVLTTLQTAKFQAVVTNVNHRVRFIKTNESWSFVVEKEESPSQWEIIPRFLPKTISDKLNVSVSLPDRTVVFMPYGLVANFSGEQNSMIFQSKKIDGYSLDDQRVLKVYAGGAIQYSKSTSF
jgi:prepilin-type N-terminal cleavage/methylation domain-containing protein